MLEALVLMVRQHCAEEEGRDVVDSIAISSDEAAILSLAEHGLLEVIEGGRIMGRWTTAGKAFVARVHGVSVKAAFAPRPRLRVTRYRDLGKPE